MKEKIKEILSSQGFKERATNFIGSAIHKHSDTAIGELFNLELFNDIVDHLNFKGIHIKSIKKYQRFLFDSIEFKLNQNNESLADVLNKNTIKKIHDFLSEPFVLPEEAVREFVNQDAIGELLITIIKDSIIAFNKKINPLSGALSILGIENQIKSFLKPFMPTVLKNTADFILSSNNQVLFTEFSHSIFDILKDEKPAPYLSCVSDIQKDKMDNILEELLRDEKLQLALKKLTKDIGQEFYNKIKDFPVKDFIEDISGSVEEIVPVILDGILPLLMDDLFLDFILTEVREIIK